MTCMIYVWQGEVEIRRPAVKVGQTEINRITIFNRRAGGLLSKPPPRPNYNNGLPLLTQLSLRVLHAQSCCLLAPF